jgi:hypothetical protein
MRDTESVWARLNTILHRNEHALFSGLQHDLNQVNLQSVHPSSSAIYLSWVFLKMEFDNGGYHAFREDVRDCRESIPSFTG